MEDRRTEKKINYSNSTLHTLISTLAEKLMLIILNNKFLKKNLSSIPFRLKIRKHFQPKNLQSPFSAYLKGFMTLLHNKVLYFTFLNLYTKTLGPFQRHSFHYLQTFLEKNEISSLRVFLAFWCLCTEMCGFRALL